jgi:hypothetical protein
MEQHYLDCACSDFNHVIRFTFDPEDGEVYLDVRLNAYEPWWKRVWYALRYVFGFKPPAYGHYDCTILRPDDFARLHDLLDRAQLVARQKTVAAAFPSLQDKPLQKA